MWKMSEGWWEKKHREKNLKWLTGSDVRRYEDFFGIGFRGKKVLEIGCGMARATRQIAKVAQELWVVDISRRATDKARRAGAHAIPLSEVYEKLPFDYFDLVVSHLVTQHLLDDALEYQLTYALYALTDIGQFAVQFMTIPEFGEPMTIRPGAGTVSRTPEYFQSMVEACGGKILEKRPNLVFNNKTTEGYDLVWHGWLIGKMRYATN